MVEEDGGGDHWRRGPGILGSVSGEGVGAHWGQ